MTDALNFDANRRRRIGLAEAILCAGKAPEHLADVIEAARRAQPLLLLTRLAPTAFDSLPGSLHQAIDYDALSRTGIIGEPDAPSEPARVAVVTAGTSDLGVAAEAARTLRFNGVAADDYADIGVAGLWRLLEREEALRRYAVLIVAAGMDGALFSVLGGLLPGVVIAVPTSTGYGVARGGETALNAALASCAPGVLVTNIDNGYGAACAACRILRAHTRIGDSAKII